MKETDFIQVVNEIVISQTPLTHLNSPLTDIGWDSLSNIELVAALDEKFNLQIDSDKLAECQSLADIFDIVR